MSGIVAFPGHTLTMRTSSRESTRAEREREHAAAIAQSRRVAGAMSLLVRAREARRNDAGSPLEIEFAETEVDGRALPAGVWVALRRFDVDAAVEAMTAASQTEFVIDERDVMGEGYRLECVQDTVHLPEPDLLIAQLSDLLGVPADVLSVLAEWGADDPRTCSEIDALLTSRFGAADVDSPFAAALPDAQALPERVSEPGGRLTMTVADAADVLRLDDDQARTLATLVRNAMVTITS
jgi:hypothetical protein